MKRSKIEIIGDLSKVKIEANDLALLASLKTLPEWGAYKRLALSYVDLLRRSAFSLDMSKSQSPYIVADYQGRAVGIQVLATEVDKAGTRLSELKDDYNSF